MKFILPEGHTCSISQHIGEMLSFGTGKLSNSGFWEYGCYECARAWEAQFPLDGPCWPHTGDQLKQMGFKVDTVKAGLRIRLKLGMAKTGTGEHITDRYDYMTWVAGRVPVGSVGTLYKPTMAKPSSYQPLSIKWDNIEPKPNTEFGLGLVDGEPLHYWLEAIGHETATV